MNLETNNPKMIEETGNTVTYAPLPTLVLPDQLKEETLAQLVMEVLVRKALVVDDTWSKWVLVSGIEVLKGKRALMPCAYCLGLKNSCGTCAPSSVDVAFPGATMPIPERKYRCIQKQESKCQDKCNVFHEVVNENDIETFSALLKRNINVNQTSNCEYFDVNKNAVRFGKECEKQLKETAVKDEVQMDSGNINDSKKFVGARAKLRKIISNSDKTLMNSFKDVANKCDVQTEFPKNCPLNTNSAPDLPVTTRGSSAPCLQLPFAEPPNGQLLIGNKKNFGVQCSPRLLGIVSNESVQVNTLKDTHRVQKNNFSAQKVLSNKQTNSEGVQGIFRIEMGTLLDNKGQHMGYNHDVSTGYDWELIPINDHETDSENLQSRFRKKMTEIRKNQWPTGSFDKEDPVFHGRPLLGKHDAHRIVNIPLSADSNVIPPLDPRLDEEFM